MANSLEADKRRASQTIQSDGSGRNFARLNFPSEHQFVLLDTETQKANQKFVPRIPLTFKILFNGDAEDPPALTLLINPQNMTFSNDKKINADFSRGGYVIEEWGESQDVLEFSGKIGGYYVLNPTANVEYTGLNRYDRSKSPSFQNLMYLFMLYRNNGAVYQKTVNNPQSKSSDKLIKNRGLIRINRRVPRLVEDVKNRIYLLGDVYLLYDGAEYKGAFDDFSITENAESPYTLDYRFSFIVQSRRETDNRSPDYYTQTATREVQDNTRTKFTGRQLRQFQEAIRDSLSTSAKVAANEAVNLAKDPNEFSSPYSIRTRDHINSKNYIQDSNETMKNKLKSQNLQVSDDRSAQMTQDATKIASDDYATSQQGKRDSFQTFSGVFADNGFDPNNRDTAQQALDFSNDFSRIVGERKAQANVPFLPGT